MKDNFFYIKRKDTFNFELKKFDLSDLGDRSKKFIQLYINQKPIMVIGHDLYHRDLMKFYLEQSNLKFKTRKNPSVEDVPLEVGEKYKLVGAGRIRLFGDNNLNFYDNSFDYYANLKGTDRKNLIDLFGLENIKELASASEPCFLVKFSEK